MSLHERLPEDGELCITHSTLYAENWIDASHMRRFSIPSRSVFFMPELLASSSVTFQNAKWLRENASASLSLSLQKKKKQKQHFMVRKMVSGLRCNLCLLVQ